MPDDRIWVVEGGEKQSWQVKTARESEVYHRPLDASRNPKGGWRPGLPPIQNLESLPESLREVLKILASSSVKEDPC